MPRRVAVTFIMGLDCLVDVEADGPPVMPAEEPAPIFAIEAPARARAGERFSLNAWVWLDGATPREALASTFTATVDERTRTIAVSGLVRALPAGDARAAGPRIQRALVVGIACEAGPGDWTICVPEAFQAPALPASLGGDVPAAGARWPLTIF